MEQKQKSHIRPIVIVMIFVFITIGYAYLTSALNINGATLLKKPTWDVHFENVQVKDGSVTGNQVIDEPEIDSEQTTVTFHVNLKKPGDYFEFTVDAVNAGTIDAMIDNYTDLELTAAQQKYLETSITYEDGEEVLEHQQLLAGDTAVYKVRVGYKLDLDAEDLPNTSEQLDLEFSVEFVQKDETAIGRRGERALYNILKKEAENGELAVKYSGTHQDSMDESLSTKDIYHWYASDSNESNTIKDKWNVIFANHCWWMIRTTDTGGVKLLYNGEAVDGKCLSSRTNHVGYVTRTKKTLSDTFYYGTDYTYDSDSGMFSLNGNVSSGTINVGEYTCMESTPSGTCDTLYFVDTLSSGNSYYVLTLNNQSYYFQFGKLQFNPTLDSLTELGYMKNIDYQFIDKNMTSYETVFNNSGINMNYYFADSYDYNVTTANRYTLINPYKISSTSEYSSLVGKYTFSNSSESYTSQTIYYIVGVSNSVMYYISLSFGNQISSYNANYSFADSYTYNGSKYVLSSPITTVEKIDWFTDYPDIGEGKYCCKNPSNNSCSELWYVTRTSPSIINYVRVKNVKYANDFIWNGSSYVLNEETAVTLWNPLNDSYKTSLKNAHYTCWNQSGTCSNISYIYYYSSNKIISYINLSNGEDVESARNKMMKMNIYDSVIKRGVDAWYSKYLSNYSNYIEDTVFCNDRKISDTSGWNPNGFITVELQFFKVLDLGCSSDTDRFSLNNPLAQLTYPIGLVSYRELTVMGNSSLGRTGQYYWTISPYTFDGASVGRVTIVGDDDRHDYVASAITNDYGVRPSIALIPWIQYESGDGSMANPYVVDTN